MNQAADRRPMLAAVDGAERLREVAFALLLTERRPIPPRELEALAGSSGTESSLSILDSNGWLDRDGNGSVTGSGGLSLTHGDHRLQLDEQAFRTWCAFDAIGIPAALRVDASIDSVCGVCERALHLAVRGGQPDREGPERLWLAEGGDDLRTGFCTRTVLLCGDAHGVEWEQRQAGRGELITLGEAARRGAVDWAGCATVTKQLAAIEYIGGPLSDAAETRISLPVEIVAPGGRYVRSMRCADDGAMRYVWRADA